MEDRCHTQALSMVTVCGRSTVHWPMGLFRYMCMTYIVRNAYVMTMVPDGSNMLHVMYDVQVFRLERQSPPIRDCVMS